MIYYYYYNVITPYYTLLKRDIMKESNPYFKNKRKKLKGYQKNKK
jgi:hypothetical protein